MKKLTALLLAAILCLSAAVVPVYAAGASPFADVPASSWTYRSVIRAYNEGVMEGAAYDPQTGERRFLPGWDITMREWTVLLARAFYQDEVAGRVELTWYNRQQEVLEERGIYDGVDPVKFTKAVTRYEMAVMIANIMRDLGVTMPDEDQLRAVSSQVSDLDRIPVRYREAVLTNYCLGIVEGGDGSRGFAGNDHLKREQAAAVYCRMADIVRPPQSEAERKLAEMTLDEKVGQLFVVTPESLWEAQSDGADRTGYSQTALTDQMRAGLARYPVGGIILFAANLSTPDPQKAYDAYLTIGSYLADYGFNLDFAPVADVNTNPKNVVIGSRAFGSNPALAAKMVPAALDGLHAAGVMGTVKHFPGHGDTVGDTHTGYVSVTKTWEELKNCELIPFAAALDRTDMVMAAHITLPNVTDDGLPASLSERMIREKLRGELGYDGVVITDALGMGAIAQNYTPAESAVLAIRAGVDLLLMPQDLKEAFDAVRAGYARTAPAPSRPRRGTGPSPWSGWTRACCASCP